MKITELSKLSLEIAVKSTLSNKSGLSIIMKSHNTATYKKELNTRKRNYLYKKE